MNIPVFPLPVFLLPGGVKRLKVFEPKYLHLITVATQNNGFAIVLDEFIAQPTMTGSRVEVINFDRDEHDILIVDVKCIELVSLRNTYIDEHDLLWGDHHPIAHWQQLESNQSTEVFSQLLQSFFQDNDDLSQLYHHEFIDTPNWVMCRWLEILPLKVHDKLCFFESNSACQAQEFLGDLLLQPKILQ